MKDSRKRLKQHSSRQRTNEIKSEIRSTKSETNLNECQRRKIQNTDSASSRLEHSFCFVMHRFDIVSNFDIRISCSLFWILILFRIMRPDSRQPLPTAKVP